MIETNNDTSIVVEDDNNEEESNDLETESIIDQLHDYELIDAFETFITELTNRFFCCKKEKKKQLGRLSNCFVCAHSQVSVLLHDTISSVNSLCCSSMPEETQDLSNFRSA